MPTPHPTFVAGSTVLATLKAAGQVPTVETFKAATRSAIQALELFTHSEKIGLIGEIEDAWVQLRVD